MYFVVTGVDKQAKALHVVTVDDSSYQVVQDYGFILENALIQCIRSAGANAKPLNFSVDASGKLVQDCGDFNRFSQKGSAVVLAEIKTKSGRTLGYRLLSCANNMCVNLKTEEILQKDKSMGESEHFLQNGIIRNNTVNCYPGKPYPTMTLSVPKKPTPARPATAETVDKATRPTNHVAPHAGAVKPAKPRLEDFSEKQRTELESCRKAGVDPNLLRDPNLDPQQMRILWVSKSKGCMSEAFADSRFSPDVMKFYADQLYSQDMVDDCQELLAHPELSADQVKELYACAAQGIPYTDFIGMSPEDVYVEREKITTKYWGGAQTFDADYLERAIHMASVLREFN